MYYDMKTHTVQQFRKSKTLNKKYDAILIDCSEVSSKGTDVRACREIVVPFGDSRYKHFNDKIGMYKHLDHGDPERRRLYKLRHSTYIQPGQYSAGYFSMKYLW
jgi:hypothetical protein